MEVSKSVREFKYNGVALKDPGPEFTLEQVREFYSTIYPEILNADIEGPTTVANKTVYEFRRAVGTKGPGDAQELRERLEEAMAGKDALRNPLAFAFDLESHQPLARAIARTFVDSDAPTISPASELLPPLP